jgi:hypothetical protein
MRSKRDAYYGFFEWLFRIDQTVSYAMLEGLCEALWLVNSINYNLHSPPATYMFHLRLTAERLDASIEISHYTWVLYAHDAFLGNHVDGCN